MKEPIQFHELRGYHDFRNEMERLYPQNAWVTPSELFKPFYGYTVSNFIANQMENRNIRQLRLIEIGPGQGTMMDSVLEFYRNYSLEIYRHC
mgnify:CR=1 FL=1|jgi:SAM-dependent MidA family methyltransferase